MMRLTCVTATFNAIKSGNREPLIQCVESVAKLKTEHEHLIYDGASTDGTVELLRELEAKTSGLKVVSEPDTGIFNALNKGVRDAKGECFYVLGADDYLCDPGIMDTIISEADEHVDVLASTVRSNDGRLGFDSIEVLRTIFQTLPYSHQGVIMKTALCRELGGFNEKYKSCADYDMLLRAHLRCCHFKYDFRPYAFFQWGGFSCSPDAQKYVWWVVRDRLGLTEKQAAAHRSVKSLPLMKMMPLMFHKDLAIRMGARWMARKRIRYFIRTALYPLVVITRPIRVGNDI